MRSGSDGAEVEGARSQQLLSEKLNFRRFCLDLTKDNQVRAGCG